MYRYGMRLRGFSIGCQPMDGLVMAKDGTKYYSILCYNRKLTDKEIEEYELDPLYCAGCRWWNDEICTNEHSNHCSDFRLAQDGCEEWEDFPF